MPAASEDQKKLAGIALAMKRGETPKSYSKEAAKMAKSMTIEELRDYAKGPSIEGMSPEEKITYGLKHPAKKG